jgi:hypothetical protein
MDELTAEQVESVNRLAEALYEKHLAASMQEAVDKAKQIVLSGNPTPVGVSVEYAEDTIKNLDKVEESLSKEQEPADEKQKDDEVLDEIEAKLAGMEEVEPYTEDFEEKDR